MLRVSYKHVNDRTITFADYDSIAHFYESANKLGAPRLEWFELDGRRYHFHPNLEKLQLVDDFNDGTHNA